MVPHGGLGMVASFPLRSVQCSTHHTFHTSHQSPFQVHHSKFYLMAAAVWLQLHVALSSCKNQISFQMFVHTTLKNQKNKTI